MGQKQPLRLKEIYAIRIRLEISDRIRDLALFNMVIGCRLRGCDLIKLKVRDVAHGEAVSQRAMILQQKT